jgi:hypothetical protein
MSATDYIIKSACVQIIVHKVQKGNIYIMFQGNDDDGKVTLVKWVSGSGEIML